MTAATIPGDTGAEASAPDRQVRLWDDGSLVVDHVTGAVPAKRLVVSFSHYGSNDRGAAGYAERFLRKRGFDVLAVKTGRNDWFQTLSLEQMAAIRAMLPDYKRVATYGSSMGGYGALYFADALGADMAIALSPQYSVDPAIMPGDTRWAGDAAGISFAHGPLGDVLAHGTARLFVLYDPHNTDRLHVEAMAAAGSRLNAIEIPYGGHPVGVALQESGILGRVFSDLFARKKPDTRALMRRNRRLSAQYLLFLSRACTARRHFGWADKLLTEAAKRDPERSEILFEHSRLLVSQHKPQPALVLLEQASQGMQRDAHAMAYHAHLKELCGDHSGAMALFDEAITLEPNFTVFYIAERRLMRQTLAEQARRLDMMDRVMSKMVAERDLKLGPVPGHYGLKEILGLTILPILVAGSVWFLARALGLI